jgi:ketosteroid isomerase-like protein
MQWKAQEVLRYDLSMLIRRRYLGPLCLSALMLVASGWGPPTVAAQEVPLEHCDTLPVMDVVAGGQHMRFLVDTAATTMLNLKSFAGGKAKDIQVSSWSGTLATSAKEVTIGEMVVGSTTLTHLKLPAIDLSAIGNACGGKIDGILGVDLLEKLGVSIDLKKQTAHVTTNSDEHGTQLAAEMHSEMQACLEAFNRSDEKVFTECLDPKIVLFSIGHELYGRDQVIGYFHDKYFHQQPATKVEFHEGAFHPVGEAVWYEYEFTLKSARGTLHGRGMAMCRKTDGRWRMATMHHSAENLEPAAESAK